MNVKKRYIVQFHLFIVFFVVAMSFAFALRGDRKAQFLLPGTQPGQVDTAATMASCKVCHLVQVKEFYGNMAYATRDPLFNAQLAIASNTTMAFGFDVGEYCLRCHAPSAWMAGRSHWLTVQNMYGSDLDGVNCDFCHRMIDPLNPDSTTIMGGTVPGYGNGMYVVQKLTLPVRGARGGTHPYMVTMKDGFYRKSEYCGVCHDESNIYLTENPRTTPPHLQVMYQRTYSEWLLSWFATQGDAGTCQSCHMPRSPGYGSSLRTTPLRLDIASHDFSGGNTLNMRAVRDTWDGIDSSAVDQGVDRSKAIIKTAAKLEVSAGLAGTEVKALVRITNLIGHKLPTGFPEGRRLWVSVTGRNSQGNVVFESGKYDAFSGDIMNDAQLKVYETKLGISNNLAAKYGITAGPSFNEALNDTVYVDNRIPPKGYSFEKFRERKAEPIGYHYDEGQYWDVTSYTLPQETRSLNVKILYQVASKTYVEFLRDETIKNTYDWNDWGMKSYTAWRSYGNPIIVAEQKVTVDDVLRELPEVDEVAIPVKFYLSQNFPNPFNGNTTIEYWISQNAPVSLSIYDITGKEIQMVVDANMSEGLHSLRVDASDLSSGLYFYRLLVNGNSITKKLLLVK